MHFMCQAFRAACFLAILAEARFWTRWFPPSSATHDFPIDAEAIVDDILSV
jgi:hypothetical protein